MEEIFCKGDRTLCDTTISYGVSGISPVFSAEFHEARKSDLWRECCRLNLSIHDRHLVQAALDRGEDMEKFAQGIIRKGCR